MKIIGFIKTSLLDWDGHVVASIYLPGCNFRCPFCHNRDAVLNPDIYEEIPWETIKEFIQEHNDFLDGVVITGGEPTIHEDLPDLICQIKALGVKVKLDTNGSNPSMLRDLIAADLIDYVAMDIKAPLNEKYDELTGISAPLEDIKQSIEILEESNIDREYRTTLAPILLKPSDIEAIAAYIGGTKKYAIQQFRPKCTLDPKLESATPMSKSQVKAIAENAKQYVRKVVIRGDV
ncbi:MAG: anaerobic ribonucleoside-triphosphate reductase activating protein [Euryarchaeota archaeon]|nr:anaerobic ribonucleoside-triphosphate reductase activating protein [Euryarchaeota archaeon]